MCVTCFTTGCHNRRSHPQASTSSLSQFITDKLQSADPLAQLLWRVWWDEPTICATLLCVLYCTLPRQKKSTSASTCSFSEFITDRFQSTHCSSTASACSVSHNPIETINFAWICVTTICVYCWLQKSPPSPYPFTQEPYQRQFADGVGPLDPPLCTWWNTTCRDHQLYKTDDLNRTIILRNDHTVF